MRAEDYDEFAELLDAIYDLIGSGANKTINPPAKAMFFQALAKYPLPVVRTALSAHCQDRQRGKFTPKPADIIEQIEAAASRDNRPGAEEAFALALTSMDEQNTVVWTQECAQAFAAAKPVLDASGSISARKTFIEVYERLVGEARQNRAAPHWFASPGLDAIGRAAAIKRAVASGLMLPAPAAPLQLEGMAKAEKFSLNPRQQLDHIRKMVLDGIAEKQARADAEIDARIEAEDEIGAEIQRKVNQHIGGAA
jgi:hypothetical protein